MSDTMILEVNGLEKTYAGPPPVAVISGLSFSVKEGEILAIVGESGSGKTTLLNLIAGIDSISGGTVRVKGNDVHAMGEGALSRYRTETIGYVFQFHNLLNEFNALENVMIPSLIRRYDRKHATAQAKSLLGHMGLSEREHHRIGEMSGGEQQRVAIARALVNDPAIVLADEPTGNLDKKNALIVADMLWNIMRERNKTLIIVTHSREIAERADRIMDLSGGN